MYPYFPVTSRRTACACRAVMVVRYEGGTVHNCSEHVVCSHKHKLKVTGLVNEVVWRVDFYNLKLSVVAIRVCFDTLVTPSCIDSLLQSRVSAT
jgi:hypothetical protein